MSATQNAIPVRCESVQCPKCQGKKVVVMPATDVWPARAVKCFSCSTGGPAKGRITPADAARNARYAKDGLRSKDRRMCWVKARLETDTVARAMLWPVSDLYVALPLVNAQGTGYQFTTEVTGELAGRRVLVPSLKEGFWLQAVIESVSPVEGEAPVSNNGAQEPGSQPEEGSSPTQGEIVAPDANGTHSGDVSDAELAARAALIEESEEPSTGTDPGVRLDLANEMAPTDRPSLDEAVYQYLHGHETAQAPA